MCLSVLVYVYVCSRLSLCFCLSPDCMHLEPREESDSLDRDHDDDDDEDFETIVFDRDDHVPAFSSSMLYGVDTNTPRESSPSPLRSPYSISSNVLREESSSTRDEGGEKRVESGNETGDPLSSTSTLLVEPRVRRMAAIQASKTIARATRELRGIYDPLEDTSRRVDEDDARKRSDRHRKRHSGSRRSREDRNSEEEIASSLTDSSVSSDHDVDGDDIQRRGEDPSRTCDDEKSRHSSESETEKRERRRRRKLQKEKEERKRRRERRKEKEERSRRRQRHLEKERLRSENLLPDSDGVALETDEAGMLKQEWTSIAPTDTNEHGESAGEDNDEQDDLYQEDEQNASDSMSDVSSEYNPRSSSSSRKNGKDRHSSSDKKKKKKKKDREKEKHRSKHRKRHSSDHESRERREKHSKSSKRLASEMDDDVRGTQKDDEIDDLPIEERLALMRERHGTVHHKAECAIRSLKEAEEPLHIDELSLRCRVHLRAEINEDVLEALFSNSRIQYDPDTEIFRFISEYDFRNKNDLLDGLRDFGVLLEDHILGTYRGVTEDIADLVRDGHCFVLDCANDNKRRLFFRNNERYPVLDPNLRELVRSLCPLMHQGNIENELKAYGIEPVMKADFELRRKDGDDQVAENKPKRRGRASNVKNRHLDDDLADTVFHGVRPR